MINKTRMVKMIAAVVYALIVEAEGSIKFHVSTFLDPTPCVPVLEGSHGLYKYIFVVSTIRNILSSHPFQNPYNRLLEYHTLHLKQ